MSFLKCLRKDNCGFQDHPRSYVVRNFNVTKVPTEDSGAYSGVEVASLPPPLAREGVRKGIQRCLASLKQCSFPTATLLCLSKFLS